MPTIKLNPTQYVLQNESYLVAENTDNMLSGIDSDTYATIKHNRSSSVQYYVKLCGFDASQVPSELPDDTVVKLRIKVSITSELVAGNAVGTLSAGASYVQSGWVSPDTLPTSPNVLTVDCYPNGATSLQQILNGINNGNIGIMCPLKRVSMGTAGYAYIYGGELEITYGGQDTDKLYVKENGAYKEVSKAYKKVNGVYVEQTDVTSVFVSGTNYKRGNS